MKLFLLSLLAISQLATGQHDANDPAPEYEYTPWDGWYNNYAHPDWGGAETTLFRRVPPAYADGVYEPSGQDRPNPIELSQSLMGGPTGLPSVRNRTAFLVFFGQQVVEEILDAQRPGCPPEYFNVKVPKHHHYNPHQLDDMEMPVLRSRYSMHTGYSPSVPREQLNEISAFFDGTLMYGPNKAWSDALRKFEDGLLKSTNDSDLDAGYYPAHNDIRLPYANPPPPRNHTLKPINRFFTIGNPRGNENPFLLTFGILWFRYHNYWARRIKADHPSWNDEQIFNEARKWVIATHQKIVYYDWLPNWLGTSGLEPYNNSYDPTVHPGIAHSFQSAAMRFGHTLVPPGVFRRSPVDDVHKNCTFYRTTKNTTFAGKAGLRTCNAFWNPTEGVTEHGIEAFLMGMASQKCEREDNIITPDLRGDVFGPLEFSRRDLMALNIQRARDHGIPDYNTVREAYGLKRRETYEEINPEFFSNDTRNGPEVLKNLTSLYDEKGGSIDNVDLWVGGILETTEEGPGETFRTIIKDQFRRIRNGDRFWFENYKMNKLFTEDEIKELWKINIKQVVLWTTTIRDQDIQDNPFNIADAPCVQPFQLDHNNPDHLESCTELKTFDYFHGSEASYILTLVGLGVFLILCILLLLSLAHMHSRAVQQTQQNNRQKSARKSQSEAIPAVEWVGYNQSERSVLIKLDDRRKHILVMTERRKPIRTIDLNVPIRRNFSLAVILAADRGMRTLALRVQNEYDMILKFENISARTDFLGKLQQFFEQIGVNHSKSPPVMSEKMLFRSATTKQHRQKLLEKFFRYTFSHAFKYGDEETMDKAHIKEYKEILNCELTRYEFAEALSLKPSSVFVENMFNLVDQDQDGYISYREFRDVLVIFAKGTADEKAKLLFDMYAIGENSLSRDDFKLMLGSLLELSNETISEDKIDEVVDTMFREAGFQQKERITFDDFSALLRDYKDALNYASLTIDGAPAPEPAKAPKREIAPSRARRTLHRAYRSETDERAGKDIQRRFTSHGNVDVETKTRHYPKTPGELRKTAFFNYMENHRRQIFWLSLYTLVTIGIFVERAYYYSVEREHSGLRRIAGYGVTVTRGAASGMMFTYASLMVCMCRNVITWLRETFLHRYIPFDSYIAMHVYIAYLALFFTVMHIIGHSFNLYHISSQTADDLTCLFRNFFHATDELPKFHYWCYMTLTGFTGILLTMVIMAMFVFAIPYSRRHTYRAFWFTHHMYVILIILTFLHGMGRMIQPPFTHYFFLGPLVLFAIDKLISVSRKKVEIAVVKAELLPSDVTYLEFKKPHNFEYRSGQWVRIASLVQSKDEYHPFTLTSAPHEDNLTLHIRAVGPWTWNLRNTYDPNSIRDHALPKIYLDGPYGEGHQDWYKFEVAVLVGGGIGVTPFASILKDLAHKSHQGNKMLCKKVYFLWVTRTQRQFEWMTDIIRQVEEQDVQDLVSVHIFITQFREKFDIRTTMLYICERHFQKISNRSLFTGLRSVTHFGRPDFESFFKLLLTEHSDVNVFGVFSCGPPPMTSSVEKACSSLNKYTTESHFVHHYENF